MLDRMKALVKQKDSCVLATASRGQPHCSLMAYVPDDECSKIYMVTKKDSRKYRNLLENPLVSLLIDTREDHPGLKRPEAKALTVSGTFQRIEDAHKYESVSQKLLTRHPHLKDFLSQSDTTVFCIKISSFLLLDGLTEASFEEI